MQHTVSDLTKMISTMYDKAIMLQRMEYDTPAHDRDEIAIRNLICDIQQMACLIYHDRADR